MNIETTTISEIEAGDVLVGFSAFKLDSMVISISDTRADGTRFLRYEPEYSNRVHGATMRATDVVRVQR